MFVRAYFFPVCISDYITGNGWERHVRHWRTSYIYTVCTRWATYQLSVIPTSTLCSNFAASRKSVRFLFLGNVEASIIHTHSLFSQLLHFLDVTLRASSKMGSGYSGTMVSNRHRRRQKFSLFPRLKGLFPFTNCQICLWHRSRPFLPAA